MAIALNADMNTLSSGIAGVRRKPSPLLQPAKDKLLNTKDEATLDAIKARLAAVDAKEGGVPAPALTTDEINRLIDYKVAAAIDSLDSKVSEQMEALQTMVTGLAARLDALESSGKEIREEIRALIERLAVAGPGYSSPGSSPGNNPDPNPGNKRQKS